MAPQPIRVAELIDTYDGVLLDAYGVLVDARGALEGAVELIEALERRGRHWQIVTNDSSRTLATSAARFQRLGIAANEDRIVTSGALLTPFFRQRGLDGARCMVLGPRDSELYVEEAGGEVVAIEPSGDCDVVIIGDDEGYPFLAGIEAVMGVLFRRFDRGDDTVLVCPNPDLIYPKGKDEFGFTSGAVALLLEQALTRRYRRRFEFIRLGKPRPTIFEYARERAPSDSLVMIGDQQETDIAGARAAGLDSALLTTGVSRWHDSNPEGAQPTYLLDSIVLT